MPETDIHRTEVVHPEPLAAFSAAEVGETDILEMEGLSDAPKSFGKLAWERFRHHKLAIAGAIGLLLIVALFFIGPHFSEFTFDERNVRERLQGPSAKHWFGTDEIGRDLFVRTAQGGQYSIRIGILVALFATVIGAMLGSLAGYFGGWLDVFISQVINLVLIVPALIVLSVFALNFGRDANRLSLVLALLLWTRISRVARGLVLSIKEQEYIMAARAAGASHWRIIFRHVLPNIVGALAVEVTLLLGTAIVLESTLSFLGLGVQPPNASLGTLVANAKGSIDSDPIRVLTPGIFIVLIVLCVNFLGDGLRDALDPRSRVEGNKAVKKDKKGKKGKNDDKQAAELSHDGVMTATMVAEPEVGA
jgi:peptide/nickel transport system permease protein